MGIPATDHQCRVHFHLETRGPVACTLWATAVHPPSCPVSPGSPSPGIELSARSGQKENYDKKYIFRVFFVGTLDTGSEG